MASNQQGDTEWPRLCGSAPVSECIATHHERVVVVDTLAEPEGKVTHSLGAALDTNLLVVGERVHLRGDAGVVDHGARVGSETRHGAAEVAVNLHNLLNGRRLEEGRLDTLLDAENDTLGGTDADGGRAELRDGVRDALAKRGSSTKDLP